MTDLRELQRLEPLAWRAPSAHNTQPWILDSSPDRVELRYDPARALPAGDPTQRDLLLSLGAFVEALLIACADDGIQLAFEPGVDPTRQRIGAFVTAPTPYRTAFSPDDLRQRQTSRLPYLAGRVGAEDLADARTQVARQSELHELATRDLIDLVREADRHLYESPEIVAELRTWLRLDPGDPRYRLDGLSYECLGLTRLEARAVALLLRPRVYPLVRRLRVHRSFSRSTTKLLERDCSALVLTGVADSAEDVLAHGRALLRVWLALGRRGLYTHPLSQILDCRVTERELASRVGAAAGDCVLSVFRAGRSEPPARSHRLR